MKYCFGIDIGGTKCAVILGNAEKTEDIQNLIIDKTVFETNKQGSKPILQKITQTIDRMIEKYSIDMRNDFIGIGIICGGPLDCEKVSL